jgi:hypothetical protein
MAVRPGWVNQQLLPFDSHFADVEGARVHHKTRATGPYSSVSRQSDLVVPLSPYRAGVDGPVPVHRVGLQSHSPRATVRRFKVVSAR